MCSLCGVGSCVQVVLNILRAKHFIDFANVELNVVAAEGWCLSGRLWCWGAGGCGRLRGRKYKQPGTSRILTCEAARRRGGSRVCREPPRNISPATEGQRPGALGSERRARGPLTAAALTLMHRQWLPPTPPHPPLPKPPSPPSLFAQPEHMLASHYAAPSKLLSRCSCLMAARLFLFVSSP